MMDIKLGVYVPSYGRSETTSTFQLLDDCTYVVRKSEEEAYKRRGIKKVWGVQDEEIDNYVKVTNYINEHSPEQVIFTIDDDVEYFIYRLDKNEKLTDKEIIMSEIERVAQIMIDLDIGFGAEDAAETPWNYVSEFSFKGTTGAMRWYNKKVYKSRYNEELYHNCDLDVMLNELLVNRITLKPMYFCVKSGTDTNSGGNSSKKRKDQEDCVLDMKRKWGKYFDYDFKTNKPAIRVPR